MRTSELEAHGQNDCGVCPPGVEDVGRKVDSFIRDAGEEASLHIERRLVSAGSLRCQAEPQPVGRSIGQLIPVVKEIAARILGIEDELTFTVERDFLVAQREEITGRGSGCVSKYSAYHRRHVEHQLFTEAHVVANPYRSGLSILIVVARLKM